LSNTWEPLYPLRTYPPCPHGDVAAPTCGISRSCSATSGWRRRPSTPAWRVSYHRQSRWLVCRSRPRRLGRGRRSSRMRGATPSLSPPPPVRWYEHHVVLALPCRMSQSPDVVHALAPFLLSLGRFTRRERPQLLPELSNSASLPGRAGGLPRGDSRPEGRPGACAPEGAGAQVIPRASWASATKTPSPSPRTAARTSPPSGRARPRSRPWCERLPPVLDLEPLARLNSAVVDQGPPAVDARDGSRGDDGALRRAALAGCRGRRGPAHRDVAGQSNRWAASRNTRRAPSMSNGLSRRVSESHSLRGATKKSPP